MWGAIAWSVITLGLMSLTFFGCWLYLRRRAPGAGYCLEMTSLRRGPDAV